MADINLIDENTDLSGLRKPIGWDLELNGRPYDVYSVDGYVHTIGGKWGENDYWACPAGETPTYENLVQFSGDAPTWGVTFNRKNYLRNKWDETSIEANGECWITRNGKNFYRIPARHMDHGLAKAQHILVQLQEECPLWLMGRDWKDEAIGRKIWYREQPAIIESVTSNNELCIKPDGIDSFKSPAYYDSEDGYEEDYGSGLIADLLDSNIYWFRD